MSRRLRIGLDLDGVCYKWSKTARYMLREVMPVDLGIDPVYTKDGPLGSESTDWDYIQDNVSKEHWDWLWTRGVELGLFRYGHLYSGTIVAVRKMAEIGDVHVITHRPKQAVNDTLAWLSYQNLPLAGVSLLTNQEPKSTVKPECDIYIDDKVENCVDLSDNTKAHRVYLMDRPWNKGRPIPLFVRSIVRVFSWDDFISDISGWCYEKI